MNLNIVSFLNTIAVEYPYIGSLASFISGPLSYVLFPAFFLIYALIKNKNYMYWFSLIFLSLFLSWFSAVIFKNIFKIARPFVTHTNIFALKIEPGFSFPSEHAAVYGALTYIAWNIDYRLGILTTSVAILVLLSRLFAGVHYPTDVAIGYVLGIVVSFCVVYFFKKYM